MKLTVLARTLFSGYLWFFTMDKTQLCINMAKDNTPVSAGNVHLNSEDEIKLYHIKQSP